MTTSARTAAGGTLELDTLREERSLWGDAWRRLSRNRACGRGHRRDRLLHAGGDLRAIDRSL